MPLYDGPFGQRYSASDFVDVSRDFSRSIIPPVVIPERSLSSPSRDILSDPVLFPRRNSWESDLSKLVFESPYKSLMESRKKNKKVWIPEPFVDLKPETNPLQSVYERRPLHLDTPFFLSSCGSSSSCDSSSSDDDEPEERSPSTWDKILWLFQH